MFRNLTDRTKAAIFYALAFGLGCALLPLTPLLGGLITIVYMFAPLLAVLLMLLVVTRDGAANAGWAALGLRSGSLHGWGLAVLAPFLVLVFGYGVVWLTGIGRFSVPHGVSLSPLDVGLAIGMTLLLAFGEEIGWRGYLLPHLSTLGQGRALFLSGFLHGLWHLPI